ncbi:MAG: RibD family protein, partial [Oceanicaulis sp.]
MSGPAVTLKLATSLDGRIALADGRSKWITGPQAREVVHQMRASHDAVLTGVGTVLADNPRMTARPGGVAAERQPIRAVMDTRLRTPPDAALFQHGAPWIYHVRDDGPAMLALGEAGARLQRVPAGGDERAALAAVLKHLAWEGVETVMIEAGGALAGSALQAGLVDRIEWFRAPRVIGGDGRPCIAGLTLESLEAAPIFTRTQVCA